MPKVLTVAARESFKAVLREYKKSSASGSDDRAHLQRWIDDDRAEQVWDEIRCAVRSNNLWLPPKRFIIDILTARPVAIAIAHRRKLREHYGTAAEEMGDAPDFVEVGEAGIAMDDAMRRQRRVQLVG